MNLKKIEEKKGRLKVEVEGEGHTLLNLLKSECFKAGAGSASYDIGHPLVGNPTLTVIGKNPKAILDAAAKNVQKTSKKFQTDFR